MIIVGMMVVGPFVNGAQIDSGSLVISPSQPTQSWSASREIYPGESVALAVKVEASGSAEGKAFELVGEAVPSFQGSATLWTDVGGGGGSYNFQALNTGNLPASETVTVSATWKEISSGGGGNGTRDPLMISGWASGFAESERPIFTWTLDPRLQFADGQSAIAYTVSGAGGGFPMDMSQYVVKPQISVMNLSAGVISQGISRGVVKSKQGTKGKLNIFYQNKKQGDSEHEIGFADVDLAIEELPGQRNLREDRLPEGGSGSAPHEMDPGGVVIVVPSAPNAASGGGLRAKLSLKADGGDGAGKVKLEMQNLTNAAIYEGPTGGQPLSSLVWKEGELPQSLYVGAKPSASTNATQDGVIEITYTRPLASDSAEFSLKDSVRVRLLPIELVDTKDGILDDQAPQGTPATPSTRDVNIEPKKDASDKRPQTVAWIDPHGSDNEKDPEMPWLTLRLRGTEEMGLKIRWKLKVEYKRPNGRKLPEDKVMIPDAEGWVTEDLDGAVEIYNHTKWIQEIEQKGYFGGEAELVFQLLKSDGAPLGDETKWSFYIGGKNPDPAKSRTFITEASNDIQPAMAWFAYAIAKHESKDYNGANSRYNQFWNASGRFAKVDHHAGEVLWVNNPGEGPPKGFGLFQVTGNKSDAKADIPRKQLWNWQDNVRGGLDIVAVKRGIADRYFARIQRRSAQHKTAFENCPPPNIQVGTHTFSSADAIQVYCYNGTGSHNGKPAPIDVRYPFDPAKPCGLGSDKRWFWNPHNVAGGEPYIRKVERELE